MSKMWNSFQDRVVAKALKDAKFKQQLLSNPAEALKGDMGITLQPGVTVKVLEQSSNTLYIVLPSASAEEERELSDVDLESVAGGQRSAHTKDTDTVTSAGVTKCCWG